LLEDHTAIARDYLEDVRRRLTAANVGSVTVDVEHGEITESIRAYAARVQADVIVMTAHARTMLARLWLGSVADDLLRESTLPLLLTWPADGPAKLDVDVLPQHVLIALDGMPLAEKMLPPAVKLGKLARASFTLLRVVRPVASAERPTSSGSTDWTQKLGAGQQNAVSEARAYLERVAAPLREQGEKVRTKVLTGDQPATGLMHEAEIESPALVALATHHRHGLSRLIIGSVADQVLKGAQFPVLVCKPATGS
jgi:nucleotide-binding universal stress UspA family protein